MKMNLYHNNNKNKKKKKKDNNNNNEVSDVIEKLKELNEVPSVSNPSLMKKEKRRQ